MQNAKDTFYEVLRSRLAATNPERTVAVRGVTRPAVVVEGNELTSAVEPPADCFRLRWIEMETDTQGSMFRCAMKCEVLYESAGTALNAGMDRERVLGEMDRELRAMVNTQPQRAPKVSYANTGSGKPAVTLATNIWWSDVVMGPTVVKAERLGRTTWVQVMTFEEAGEQ